MYGMYLFVSLLASIVVIKRSILLLLSFCAVVYLMISTGIYTLY